MAAIVTSAIGEVASLLGGTGIASTIGRGALIGIGSVAAADLLKAIQGDLAAGGSAAATARRIPQYAIVDLHSNKTVRFLSTRKVYSILTHPSRRGHSRAGRTRIIEVPSGARLSVK